MYSKSIRINKESVDLLLLINHFTSELTTMLWFEYWLDHDCLYYVCNNMWACSVDILCIVRCFYWMYCFSFFVILCIMRIEIQVTDLIPPHFCVYYYSLYYFHQPFSWSTLCCNILVGIVIHGRHEVITM